MDFLLTFSTLSYIIPNRPFCYAGVMKLVDMQDLGSCEAIRVGSSPTARTKGERYAPLFCLCSSVGRAED